MSKSLPDLAAYAVLTLAVAGGLAFFLLPRSSPELSLRSLPRLMNAESAAMARPKTEALPLADDQPPERLAAYFFFKPPATPHANADKAAAAAPIPSPSPVPVEAPQLTADLRFVGEVVIDGAPRWAFYDVVRQTSFSLSPGESWADWTCVAKDGNTIIMRKHEKSYLVQYKK